MERNMRPAYYGYFFRVGRCLNHLISAFLLYRLVSAESMQIAIENLTEAQILLNFRNNSTSVFGVFSPQVLWTTWNETDPNRPCTWVGVDCTPDSRIVEGLDFSGWGLDPGMPNLEMLSGLEGLRRLDLSYQAIPFLNWITLTEDLVDDLIVLIELLDPNILSSGDIVSFKIPAGIGTLTNLTYLNLSGNRYSGEIPDNFSYCTKLRDLVMADNLVEGGISALANISSLETLHFSNNRLNSSFPTLAPMPGLVIMDLSNNQLVGTVSNLSHLPELRILKLDNNSLKKLDGSFFSSARMLEQLSVSGNQLEGSIPHSLTHMSNLQVLNLSNNHLSGQIPSEIARNTSQALGCFTLDLSSNKLNGSLPAKLIGRPLFGLISINISHNSLSGNIPTLLEQLSPGGESLSLISLDLSHNQLSGALPPVTGAYNGSLYLKFYINDNQFSGDIVDWLIVMESTVSEYLIFEFGMLEVHVQDNSFTGDMSKIAPNSLQLQDDSAEILQVLDLSNNDLHWSTLANGVQDPLSELLQSLPEDLREFRVGGNDFSGISISPLLPSSENWNNTVLEVLDLSNTNLTGDIGDADFLNNATLPSLQVLDLSNNDVTGKIPPGVVLFQKLTYFDVSHNQLDGSLSFIEPGTPLYNSSFFLDNSRLCGGPLPPCRNESTGVPSWVIAIIVGVSTILVLASGLAAAWRWRVYNKRHQQDAELIRTLKEGESATLMSLRELKRATNNFAESGQIGEGGFGKVFRGKLSNGTVVAIKRSKGKGIEKDKEKFLNEVRILTQLNHRYLLELLGCCLENKIALLVFEFVSNGTLQDHLRGEIGADHLSWKQRLKIAVQTADALNYLHSAAKVPIHHRDVKSANILLDDDLNAKVADFGISKVAPVEDARVSTMAVHGTMGYIDPEYYTSLNFTDKSDVYSFGVVLLELIAAKPAIDGSRIGEERSLVLFAIPLIKSGNLDELIDPSLLETYHDPTGPGKESVLSVGRLAVECLNMGSKARPSMQVVLKELQNLHWSLEGELQRRVLTIHEETGEYPLEANHVDFLTPESDFDSRSTSPRSIEMSQSSP